jgi:hypothetical protein
VDGTQIGIFKEADQIGFGRFLQGQDGAALKAEIALEILGDLTDQTLEGELADQQVGRLLVPTNLAQGDCTRTVTMRLLDTTRGRGGLARRLGGELFARSFASGAFTGAANWFLVSTRKAMVKFVEINGTYVCLVRAMVGFGLGSIERKK